jgi:hypothetical protein
MRRATLLSFLNLTVEYRYSHNHEEYLATVY